MQKVAKNKSQKSKFATELFLFAAIFVVITSSFSTVVQGASTDTTWYDLDQECIEGDCVDGQGSKIYYSSQKYVGTFKNGRRHGMGTIYLPLNIIIEGEWLNDEIIKGTALFSDGKKYIGTWEFGYRHGKGELTYPDGRKYVGDFHAGNRHGTGKMIYPDGRIFIGKFRDGKRTGSGTMTYPDGKKKSGVFKEGNYQEKAK